MWPGASQQLQRRYSRADGPAIDLYVAYFASQAQGREVVGGHSMELHNQAAALELRASRGVTFLANYTTRPTDYAPTLFWYDVGTGPETSRYVVKGRTLWNAIWRGRSDGAVVVMTIGNANHESPDRLFQEFAPLVADALAERLSAKPAGFGT
jgi:EpsI family protein